MNDTTTVNDTTLDEVPLPALDGRSPLGFLAAVGLLRLLTRHDGQPAQLAWSPQTCTATLRCRSHGIDELVAAVEAVVARIGDGGVLPEVPPTLPPPGEAPDGLRLTRPDFAERAVSWIRPDAEADRRAETEAWLAGLVTDLAVDARGRVEITLFAAPSGKQSLRTMLEKPLEVVRDHPEVLREALLGWRRYPGVTGEYLDHRVVFDAGDAADGRARERGVPGATWLALMALPVLPCTAVDGRPVSVGWHRFGPRSADRRLVYPLWRAPFDLAAVTALLRHPLLAEAVHSDPTGDVTSDGSDRKATRDAAAAFTVFRICRAQRRRLPGRTFAGVLAPLS